MKINRRKTKVIYLGRVAVGGSNPISIQSMTNTDTANVWATVRQIHELEELGCEIIRVAVPDVGSVDALPEIMGKINIPLVADIHFDWELAVKAIEKGVSGIRINPGNIGGIENLAKIVKSAKKRKVPIRIGVNSGSLGKKWIKKYKGITSRALVSSALEYIKMIEGMGFNKLKISLKAPDIERTIDANRLISKKVQYPLHIGITEAGLLIQSAVKSSMALGTLLMEGIGDTMRVSITGNPHSEVIVAKEILQNLGLRKFGPQIVSCPTCARCKVNLYQIVKEVDRALPGIKTKVKSIAIMGCVVNGPGEAKESDIGIACGRGSGVLFKKGRPVRRVAERNIVKVLIDALE